MIGIIRVRSRLRHDPTSTFKAESPSENDMISVGVGYDEDIEDDELRELKSFFGGSATHSEGSQSYNTGRDGIHKCDVARLSHKDYIEYIVPLPVDEE